MSVPLSFRAGLAPAAGIPSRVPPSPGTEDAEPSSPQPRPASHHGARRLPEGWPLVTLFAGYPLWWLLGLSSSACLIAAVPMAYALLKRDTIRVPRGFGSWLLFLAWVVVGVFLLQVDAPGTAGDSANTRYLVWAQRLAWYLTATITLLYVGTLRRRLSSLRVVRALSWMFVTITAGGLLGLVAPHLSFPSLLEVLLPARVSGIGFVHSLIHPTVAQLQDILGYAAPRPSAPFTYTNAWGLNYVCFLPFFLRAWCARDAGWRRLLAPPVLLASTVPVVMSLNRGLWIALLCLGLFVAIRSAAVGRLRLLGAVLGGVGVLLGLLALTSLGDVVEARIAHPHSNQGRANMGTLTVESVAGKSPIVGYGTTRHVQGTFSSIAGGATPQCPHCDKPSLGTQGHLWLVSFSQGFAGLALYLGFLAYQFFRHLRLRSPYVTVGLCVVLAHVITMPVYDAISPALLAVMVGVALMWRESDSARSATGEATARIGSTSGPTLASYGAFARRYLPVLVVCALTGAVLGGGWQLVRGTPSIASIGILVPAQHAADSFGSTAADTRPTTMDTEAQLVRTPAVLSAMSDAAGRAVTARDPDLLVTATPNTRILHLTYTAPTATAAQNVVEAGARALLKQRRGLEAARDADTGAGRLVRTADSRASIVRPSTVRPVNDGWTVSVTSGLMLGLAFGVVFALFLHLRTGRLQNPRKATKTTDLPVLARVPAAGPALHDGLDLTLDTYRPMAYLSADSDGDACALARDLDGRLRAAASDRVVVVASTRCRARAVHRLVARLRTVDIRVVGLILVEANGPNFGKQAMRPTRRA